MPRYDLRPRGTQEPVERTDRYTAHPDNGGFPYRLSGHGSVHVFHMRRQIFRSFRDAVGTRAFQFGPVAIAPKDADRSDLIGVGPHDVVQAVANHDGGGRLDRLLPDDVADQVRLFRVSPIEFGPVDRIEMAGKIKMIEEQRVSAVR